MAEIYETSTSIRLSDKEKDMLQARETTLGDIAEAAIQEARQVCLNKNDCGLRPVIAGIGATSIECSSIVCSLQYEEGGEIRIGSPTLIAAQNVQQRMGVIEEAHGEFARAKARLMET